MQSMTPLGSNSRKRTWLALASAVTLSLGACSQDIAEPAPMETNVPEDLQGIAPPAPDNSGVQIGTPMADRVATIGLINKRNNETRDLEMKPGDSVREGNIIIRLQACERTPPWEMPQETGAFVQVLVQARGSDDFASIFSGWLFKNSPGINVVEHPIYDVWVKDCAMSFPGE